MALLLPKMDGKTAGTDADASRDGKSPVADGKDIFNDSQQHALHERALNLKFLFPFACMHPNYFSFTFCLKIKGRVLL